MVFLFLFQVLAIVSVLFIEHKRPEEAAFWACVLTVLPVVGLLLYLALGSTLSIKLTYWVRSRRIQEPFMTMLENQRAFLETMEFPRDSVYGTVERVIRFHMECTHSMIARHNSVDILTTGEQKYEALFADMLRATSSIHVSYYAIHNDDVGKQLVKILTERAQNGVKVRVMFDGLGSLATPRSLFQPLLDAGGHARRIKPNTTHFRNHRKIVVIDGKIGYTGGMNIGNKYLGKNPKKTPWRDTHLRVEGESVPLLQYYFLYDWFFANKSEKAGIEESEYPLLLTPIASHEVLPCQVVTGGIEAPHVNIKLSVLRLITAAKSRILIQSPYFIPSETILDALRMALASGVQVTLMLPAQRSSFFLEPTTGYYIRQLLPDGLKVLLYEGYIHAKTITVDDSITCIGSANMDIRSLEIDDEVQMIFYDRDFNRRHSAVFEDDTAHCHPLDTEAFMAAPLRTRFKERFYRLFAPFM